MIRRRALHPAECKYVLDAARGLTAAETARKHGVSVNTVNSSLANAKEALFAHTIAHAVALALAFGEFTANDIGGNG